VEGDPNTAPSSARVPVWTTVIGRITGSPVTPGEAFGLPGQDRLRTVSGPLTDTHPSNATVR
jgi:hypothetical protein